MSPPPPPLATAAADNSNADTDIFDDDASDRSDLGRNNRVDQASSMGKLV